MDPDVDAGEQNASMARRRCNSSATLDREVPLCGREVFETRHRSASTLHRHGHRHRPDQHQLLLQLFHRSGAAAPRLPERGGRAQRIHGSASTSKSAAARRSSAGTSSSKRTAADTKHHTDHASISCAPPAGTHSPLRYIHEEIWGSPTLPPPERPAEGERTHRSSTARWGR